MISVIIPVATASTSLEEIRKRLSKESFHLEVLIVINKDHADDIMPTYPLERILISNNKGRGFSCSKGIQSAKGKISILLHADTFLPPNWNDIISSTMENKNTVGGAFSLSFDTDHTYLRFLIFLSDLFFKFTGELWGDRAIFFRTSLLKEQEFLEVPIMEDIKLSNFLKKKGKVVMVKEKVITSSATFLKYGLLHHTYRIVKCRLWYALGGDLSKIYNHYYS